MKAPVQKIKVQKFSADKSLIACIHVKVIFDFEGYDMDAMMELITGGQPPRVAYQSELRELNKDDFIRLDGTTQVVMVKDLYANTGRKGVSMQTAFLRMEFAKRDEFIAWALEHLKDDVMPKPVKAAK